MTKNKIQKIGIIGSGVTGLTLAYLISRKLPQAKISIFDRPENLGGLGASTTVNQVPLEKFYHHFFTSDIDLIELAKSLNIDYKIKQYPSSVGFYLNHQLHPFTTPLDLLKFTPISFVDRIKMGLLTLYFTKKSTWRDLEKYTCQQFFDLIKAPKLYQTIWKPLLNLKFGQHEPNIPATFLWGRLNPRGRSRKGLKEELCYFDNGFQTLFDTLKSKLVSKNVHFVPQEVKKITQNNNFASLTTSTKIHRFDQIVFTGSNPKLIEIYPQLSPKLKKQISTIQYQAINCLILETKKQLSPYYWLNIVDPNIPFAGFIEHTNLVPKDQYQTHLVYLFNYLPTNHPIYRQSPQKVFEAYLKGVKQIFPDFKKSDVTNWQLFRHPFATPIYSGKYSQKIPPFKLSSRLFLANTSQVYPEDRNISNGIKLAHKIVRLLKHQKHSSDHRR